LHRKMQKNRKTANNKVEKMPKTKKRKNKNKLPIIKDLQVKLAYQPEEKPIKTKLKQCPRCKKSTLEVVLNFDARGPPKLWKEKLKNIKRTKTAS